MSRFAFYASRLKESVAKRISLRKMRVGRYVTSLYVSLGRILWACFATSGVVEPVHRSVMPVGQPCLMGVSHIERSGHSDRCHGNSAKLSRSGGGDVSHSATIRPERLEQIVRRPVLHHDDDDVALFLLFVDLQQQHGKTCRNYPTRTKYRGSMSFTVWTAPTKFWHATLGQKTGSSSKNPLPVPTQFSFSAGEIKIAEGSVQLSATTTPIVGREQCERVAEPRGGKHRGKRGHQICPS